VDNRDDETLIGVLERLEALLSKLDLGDKAAWLAERRDAIELGARPINEVRSELHNVVTGMGSLMDFWIADLGDRQERDALADELYALTDS
jgi:hypothetical protein